MNTVKASFDPITQSELEEIVAYRKKNHLKELYVFTEEDGILDLAQRQQLVKRALKPYRHIHITYKSDSAENLHSHDEEKVRSGEFRLAAKGIRKQLIDSNAYLAQIVAAHCKPHRAIHSKGVAETAAFLAKAHHMDEKTAYRAGYLHDVTKALTEEEGRKIIARWKPEWLQISPKVWHSYTAVIFLKQNMGLYDHKILSAIEHHTIGDGNSDLERIIYIADKTEPSRNYDSSKERALAAKDLQAAAQKIREESKAYIYEKEGICV